MIKNGVIPHKTDHRSYSYHKTFGSIGMPELPPEVNTDGGLWMPNQNTANMEFNNLFTEPEGCTNFAQCDLASDYTKVLHNPAYLESKTHANALGGYDIGKSFQAMIDNGVQDAQGNITYPYKQYFQIQPHNGMDWFDTIRATLFLGINDNRSISIGTPWFSTFEQVGADGILKLPTNLDTTFTPWHDWKCAGYTTTNTAGQLIRGGETFLRVKSWQGTSYGDKGWAYFDRATVNGLMGIYGTIALIGSPVAVPNIQTIDVSWVEWVFSFVRLVNNNYIMRPLSTLSGVFH